MFEFPGQYIGVLAQPHQITYQVIHLLWQRGQTYVPLNPKFPLARLQAILKQVPLDTLVLTQAQSDLLPAAALALFQQSIKNIVTLKNQSDIEKPPLLDFRLTTQSLPPDQIAYILFTSGSTGEPKGVPITYENLATFVHAVQARYDITEQDRIAQFTLLNFDMSIFDLAMAFTTGAQLLPIPEEERLVPANFLCRHNITILYIVPSVITRLAKLDLLKPGSFPSLRWSLFAGEALSIQAAEAWQTAAPHSQIENLYGPTEATVSCLRHLYTKQSLNTSSLLRPDVPIGTSFPGTFSALINEQLEFILPGQRGELVLAGKQLTAGYWQKPEVTAEKFINLAHPTYGLQRWYRTGDLAIEDEAGLYHYLGRLDHQIKIGGIRIELEEIEVHIKSFMKTDEIAVTTVQHQGDTRLVAVYCLEPSTTIPSLKSALKQHLPDYMIPSFWQALPALPYNMNGKLDRKQLQLCIQEIFSKRV